METARRCVVVYGHFYQPPRENPWIEAIEKQPSAQPAHDWNERVAAESYIPNQAARVVGGEGILDIVNNYAWLGFNFGPTLLSWYAEAHPHAYAALPEADKESRARLGHGNANAQAYSHMILPLANERDKVTQVRWGLADFKKRFGRDAEAMWLPETAVDSATLKVLIDHGMKYVVLAPQQALRARPLRKGARWVDVSDGSVDPKRPYAWFDKDARGHGLPHRSIQLFFYDGNLAKSVAFEHAMRDSKGFADRIEACFDPKRPGAQLVHLAADGETFGHHDPYAEMGLAHLLKYELPRRGIEVINHAAFLRLHPPTHEAEIKENSSWSCEHGVGRWSADCGCASGGGVHQRWRAPLRAAYDWLRDQLTKLYEDQGQGFFKDPWAARDAYIEVILDRSRTDAFLAGQLVRPPSPEERVKALKLLELQRHSILMYTSCAWFFEELSRIEPVQTIKYAARAIQLARQLGGPDLEPRFLELLKEAPSNIAEFGDGWGVYEKLVRPAVVTPEHLAAQHGISLLYGELPKDCKIHHYLLSRSEEASSKAEGAGAAAAGELTLTSGITGESWRRRYLAVALKDRAPLAWVGPAEASFDALKSRVQGWTASDFERSPEELRGDFFQGQPYSLENLFADERDRVYSLIISDKIARLDATYDELFREYFPVVEDLAGLKLTVPTRVRQEVELALGHWLAHQIAALSKERSVERVEETRKLLARAKAAGLGSQTEETEAAFTALVREVLAGLDEPKDGIHAFARAVVALGLEGGWKLWRHQTETRVFRLLRERLRSGRDGAELKSLQELGRLLGLAVDIIVKNAASPS